MDDTREAADVTSPLARRHRHIAAGSGVRQVGTPIASPMEMRTTVAAERAPKRGERARAAFKRALPLARVVNPLAVKLAGRRALPLYGVIEHQGRRSGRGYRTPVWTRRFSDGFVFPLLLGDDTDWCRNVLAA